MDVTNAREQNPSTTRFILTNEGLVWLVGILASLLGLLVLGWYCWPATVLAIVVLGIYVNATAPDYAKKIEADLQRRLLAKEFKL